jgi:hypothetical protein
MITGYITFLIPASFVNGPWAGSGFDWPFAEPAPNLHSDSHPES